jgi:integrase
VVAGSCPVALAAQSNPQSKAKRIAFSVHTLRHTFLCKVAQAHGVEFPMQISGHASSKYIGRYVKPSDEQTKAALENLFLRGVDWQQARLHFVPRAGAGTIPAFRGASRGGKDRYLMLSTTLLEVLRVYWRAHPADGPAVPQ